MNVEWMLVHPFEYKPNIAVNRTIAGSTWGPDITFIVGRHGGYGSGWRSDANIGCIMRRGGPCGSWTMMTARLLCRNVVRQDHGSAMRANGGTVHLNVALDNDKQRP